VTPGLLVLASYLIGSIPISYLAGRWTRGIDLREHGSGNLGATNTFRVLGPKVATPVMVFDILKGFIPPQLFGQWDGSPTWEWALAFGAAAILGHVFSIYLGFRGGKGVATGAGVFLALSPEAVLPAMVIWILVLAGWRMVSLASICAALALPISLFSLEGRMPVRLLGVAVAAFVIFAHRSNIRRIFRGEEYRIGQPMTATRVARREEG
jgi:acyl phosphate:glycerol-3-phosphate acyltransferase